jgi:hypothetical protein
MDADRSHKEGGMVSAIYDPTNLGEADDPRDLCALLNDRLRCRGVGGKQVITDAVYDIGDLNLVNEVFERVAAQRYWDDPEDPDGTRSFGRIQCGGHRFVWVIDCFELGTWDPAEDPTDPDGSWREMTLMLESEWE